ncbi:hypothetical protein Tco_1170065 [Tanacetum coccineum]
MTSCDDGNPSSVNLKQHCDSRSRRLKYKDQDFANSDIKEPSQNPKASGDILAAFKKMQKYEHVGQDTRSQDGKDDKDKQGKDLKISESKSKLKDNDKG